MSAQLTDDGAGPGGSLIADAKGDLFGTTSFGGANKDGTVFELVKTGSGYTEKVLHSFRGGTTDGAYPKASLIADAKGDLFSTTNEGGAYGAGTVFELVKTGSNYTEKVLHSFGAGTDGLIPMPACSPTPRATCSARPMRAARTATARCSSL
jgi:uncharacterized repeat protein (TIGR03803 family)